ncbi:MAG: sulfotransferase [Pseudomonadales bacterium]
MPTLEQAQKFIQKKDFAAALNCLLTLDKETQSCEEIKAHIAFCHLQLDQPGKAQIIYRQVLDTNPQHVSAARNLAICSAKLGKLEIHQYKLMNASSWNTVGVNLYYHGQFTEARSALEQAIECDTDYINAYFNISDLIENQHLKQWIDKTADIQPPPEQQGLWWFFLASLHDRAGNYAKATKLYLKANDYMFEHSSKRWHADAAAQLCTNIIQTHDKDFCRNPAPERDPTNTPQVIFIVGMPRCGSTLTSRIVGNQANTKDLGEVTYLVNTINEVCEKHHTNFPQLLAQPNQDICTEIRESYLHKAGNPTESIVIDKYLENFLFAGVIPHIFPGAKIIHCQRNKDDVFLSCFKHYFNGNVVWSNKIEQMHQYHEIYTRYMQHWQNTLPNSTLHTLEYEKLVTQPEHEQQGLADFLGIAPQALTEHTTNQTTEIKTASAMQARKPLYQNAIGSYENYRQYIEL